VCRRESGRCVEEKVEGVTIGDREGAPLLVQLSPNRD